METWTYPRCVPFPWYGTKKRWGDIVWRRLGNPKVYVEPFAGSAALLFLRPQLRRPRREVLVDLDGFIVNFWRSVKYAPDAVAEHVDLPPLHVELTPRHRWLVEWARDAIPKLSGDAEWHDPKAAGWWCWGLNIWIGAGWCGTDREFAGVGTVPKMQATLTQPYAPQDQFMRSDPRAYFRYLQKRLRDVYVLHCNWKQATTNAALAEYPRNNYPVAVVLDPPYLNRNETPIYTTEELSGDVARESYEWALEHGDRYRIVYFCNPGDFTPPDDWETVTISRPTLNGTMNRDAAFFSPKCREHPQRGLFD